MVKKQYLAIILAILGLSCLTIGLTKITKQKMLNYGLAGLGCCFTAVGLFMLSFKKFVMSTGSPGSPGAMPMGSMTSPMAPPMGPPMGMDMGTSPMPPGMY